MTLHCELDHPTEGAETGERIVLVHGFGQTCRCWGAIKEDLARDHEIVRVDAPGHGQSAGTDADLVQGARLIADVGGHATYIGYSMGARFALHVALARPDIVSRLVLVGGTPGIENDEDRAARRERDLATAARIRRDGVDSFLATWFDQPLFATLPPEAQFLEERRRNTAEGLARSLELAGTGSQASLWGRLRGLEMPVLVIAGEHDERYRTFAERLAQEVGGNATSLVIGGAGHAAHLEQPGDFLTAVRSWLAVSAS